MGTQTRVSSTVVVLSVLVIAGACIGQEAPADWEVAVPRSVKVNPDLLDDLRVAAQSGTFQNLHSILIVRRGKLVFEEYLNGFDSYTLQYTASVSKSAGSILLGIAMDQGLVPGLAEGALDVPLADLLPEYSDLFESAPAKRNILLRHALSMSGGLAWDETTYPYSDSRNDWIRASQGDDPVGFALSRPVIADAGVTFAYHGVYSILPSYLIERETGASAEDFAAEHLFGPLGITEWEWETIASGLTDTDGGLHLRPRDMAKLGQLYLDRGVWDDKRIVSEAWVAESSRRQIANAESPDYCLLWWCGDFHYGDRTAWTFFASGHGGQKIFVFPEHEMVVVVTQQVFGNPFDELNNMAILSRYVLPAVDTALHAGASVHLDPEALALHEGVYSGSGAPIRIELRDGTLFAESQDAPTMELIPLGGGRYTGTVLDLIDVQFRFEPGEAHRAETVSVTWGFREEEFTRADP